MLGLPVRVQCRANAEYMSPSGNAQELRLIIYVNQMHDFIYLENVQVVLDRALTVEKPTCCLLPVFRESSVHPCGESGCFRAGAHRAVHKSQGVCICLDFREFSLIYFIKVSRSKNQTQIVQISIMIFFLLLMSIFASL